MHSTPFFKTKRSSILPRLKTKQIKQFCNVKKIIKIQKNTIFQNRGRPQGNTNKVGNREFQKKAARRATQTKKANRVSKTKPPAGQHKQRWEISIFHPMTVPVASCGCGCRLRLEIKRRLPVTGCRLEFQPTGCRLRLEIFLNKEPDYATSLICVIFYPLPA